MRIWIIALGVVAVLALAGGYWYGSWESDEVLVKQSADTASEGIKVHGDWEVTVSDPATGEEMVYAFENKLAARGNALLALLLRGSQGIAQNNYGTYANQWSLSFEGLTGSQKDSPAETSIFYPDSALQWDDIESFQLISSFIVPAGAESFDTVAAILWIQPNSIPSLLDTPWLLHNDPYGFAVTKKQFDNPIPVQPGQEVSATVRISFE